MHKFLAKNHLISLVFEYTEMDYKTELWPELPNDSCESHQAKVDMAAFPKPSTVGIRLRCSFATS